LNTASPEVVTSPRKPRNPGDGPYYVEHESFALPDAEELYGPESSESEDFDQAHMPDDTTRDHARRMHYAAYRMAHSEGSRRKYWQAIYLRFRDRIVLGNRKLVYRAVRRWTPASAWGEDMIGDCQVVLIQAVGAYNPWLGIRFSTYAFTCLMRALSRLSQRHAADRLARSVPLEALPDGEPRDLSTDDESPAGTARLDEFLNDSHDLLSSREKMVLQRRFSLDEQAKGGTLEEVGRELGLSKERVRQVQACALGKLRKALLEGTPVS
jgi:RNA polymerase sigma factor (sigma-70 family)